MKNAIHLLLLLLLVSGFTQTERLVPYRHFNLRIEEPSDICRSEMNPEHFFIVSNRGSIAEIDESGKILRRTKYDGSDYEAICMMDTLLYVMDESLRKLEVRSAFDLSLKRTHYLSFHGRRNGGFESFCYIPEQKKFIAVTESPVIVYELNEQLQVLNQMSYKHFDEISSVTYHKDFLWFLSDQTHEVMKVIPNNFALEKRWKINLVNPEGICFNREGDLMIVSDDMGMLFQYKMN